MAKRKTTRKKRELTLEELRAELPRVDSTKLSSLRDLVAATLSLKELIGPIAQFHVVVDANILIREVLWAAERENPVGRTKLHECIRAGTIIAYATPRVMSEVEEHLPVVAAGRERSIETYLGEWAGFRALVRIEEPDFAVVEKYAGGQDPDDAPTIALAEIIGAIGIFTRDTDIAAMDGNCIPESFMTAARDYSRQAALNVTIQVSGYYIAIGAGHGFMGTIAVLESCATWFRGLRMEFKVLLFLALIATIAHPRSRTLIVSALTTLGQRFPYRMAVELLQCATVLGEMVIANPAVPPSLPNQDEGATSISPGIVRQPETDFSP